jgi:hypothetical protein
VPTLPVKLLAHVLRFLRRRHPSLGVSGTKLHVNADFMKQVFFHFTELKGCETRRFQAVGLSWIRQLCRGGGGGGGGGGERGPTSA